MPGTGCTRVASHAHACGVSVWQAGWQPNLACQQENVRESPALQAWGTWARWSCRPAEVRRSSVNSS